MTAVVENIYNHNRSCQHATASNIYEQICRVQCQRSTTSCAPGKILNTVHSLSCTDKCILSVESLSWSYWQHVDYDENADRCAYKKMSTKHTVGTILVVCAPFCFVERMLGRARPSVCVTLSDTNYGTIQTKLKQTISVGELDVDAKNVVIARCRSQCNPYGWTLKVIAACNAIRFTVCRREADFQGCC